MTAAPSSPGGWGAFAMADLAGPAAALTRGTAGYPGHQAAGGRQP